MPNLQYLVPDIMSRGTTLIGTVVVGFILIVLIGFVLVRSGGINPNSKGILGLLSRTGDFASRVVPLPKESGVKNIGTKIKGLLSGSGFEFDSGTPGYENLAKLDRGCPFKDCIPSIDDPKFESSGSADQWLVDTDVVFALVYEGQVKAYPQRIMNWHEIVNDQIPSLNDKTQINVAVTFCPLCGSALAFERNVDGQVLEFGVSGFLHENDLVMYDRQTKTLWQQITGEGIVGEHFGKRLKQIPMSGMRWADFKKEFPNGLVLSRDTGFSRDYDKYPYGDYEESGRVNFPLSSGQPDTTIHPKTVVYGVEVDGKYKAYPEEKIKDQGLKMSDRVGEVEVEIDYNNGDVTVIRLDTGQEIPATRLFWFAWKAFRPETELY